MPVYEYQCKACSREFEYQQRMSDPDKTTCEVCGGNLERLISRTAFQLKGGGWYKDLYSSAKPSSGDAKAGSSDTGGSSDKAADKPAATSSDSSASSGTSSGASGGATSGGSSSGGGSASTSATA